VPSRLNDFLAELKRRRVYTVGVTYVVVGLGVLGAVAWRFDQALAARDAVLALEPRSVIATYLGAQALTMLGRHRESLDHWARVLELSWPADI
jgi:tetratricopeptide (TPR) repeat protein